GRPGCARWLPCRETFYRSLLRAAVPDRRNQVIPIQVCPEVLLEGEHPSRDQPAAVAGAGERAAPAFRLLVSHLSDPIPVPLLEQAPPELVAFSGHLGVELRLRVDERLRLFIVVVAHHERAGYHLLMANELAHELLIGYHLTA